MYWLTNYVIQFGTRYAHYFRGRIFLSISRRKLFIVSIKLWHEWIYEQINEADHVYHEEFSLYTSTTWQFCLIQLDAQMHTRQIFTQKTIFYWK